MLRRKKHKKAEFELQKKNFYLLFIILGVKTGLSITITIIIHINFIVCALKKQQLL